MVTKIDSVTKEWVPRGSKFFLNSSSGRGGEILRWIAANFGDFLDIRTGSRSNQIRAGGITQFRGKPAKGSGVLITAVGPDVSRLFRSK